MKVKQLINDKGNAAANQFVIEDGDRTVFQSYNTIIAEIDEDGTLCLDRKALDYSRTTSKHLYIFLRDYTVHQVKNRKDVERVLMNEKDVLVGDLNNA